MLQQTDMMAVSSRLIPINGAASTLIGGRPENQDNLSWADTPLGFLFVVCDGMGGGPGGRTASALAVATVVQAVAGATADADRAATLRRAVGLAEEALEERMRADHKLMGMGSTLVALLISTQSAMIAHLGDSRCYRFHAGAMLFRTMDHSLVAELVRNKALTEEQARTSPQSNVITRGLGSTSNHVAEIQEVPYRAGDRFVLCTDGIWGIMPHGELLRHLGAQVPPATIVTTLQQEVDRRGASAGGGHDNHTIAILETGSESTLKDPMSKQVKIIIATLTAMLLVSLIVNATLFANRGGSPDTTALELAQSQIANTKRESAALANANEETLKKNFVEIEQLKQQVANLEIESRAWAESYKGILSQSDSLQKELDKAHDKIAKMDNTAWPKPLPKGAKTKSEAKAMADEILDSLYAMRDRRAKNDWHPAARMQYEARQKIDEKLLRLSLATEKKYDKDIGAVRISLRTKDITNIDNSPDKNNYFHPTGYALNIINQTIKQYETIHKKIK
jgi:serine/threonine protein phosphatase PrpC